MKNWLVTIGILILCGPVMAITTEEAASLEKAEALGIWTRPRAETDLHQPEPVMNSISADMKLWRVSRILDEHLESRIDENEHKLDKHLNAIIDTRSHIQELEDQVFMGWVMTAAGILLAILL